MIMIDTLKRGLTEMGRIKIDGILDLIERGNHSGTEMTEIDQSGISGISLSTTVIEMRSENMNWMIGKEIGNSVSVCVFVYLLTTIYYLFVCLLGKKGFNKRSDKERQVTILYFDKL